MAKRKLSEAEEAYQADLKRRQLFQAVFSTPEGKEVLSHLRAVCFMDHHGFVAGEPETSFFNWGQHAVYTYIASMLKEMPKNQQEVAIDE